MRSPGSLHPMLRSVLALAFVAAFEGCGGGDGPLDPASGSTAEPTAQSAASSPVPAEGLANLTTSQRIAFGSSYISTVYKMDPQGSQRYALMTHSPGAHAPAWSWDNTKLAMVSPRTSNGVTRDDIVLMNADGTNEHWARSQASVWDFEDPSWHPNGSRILMTVKVGGTTPTLGWLEAATGTAALFYFPGGGAILGSRPSFNKAGTKILYVGRYGKTIEQINADGSGHTVRISASVKLDYPSFSPDGGRIAYQKTPVGGNPDIFVKNLTTGVTTRLTFSTAADAHPSWSPDGVRIAFMSKRTGARQIFTMKSAMGGDVLRLSTDNYTEDYDPAWTH
jgi:Tol biopolymer transport system component